MTSNLRRCQIDEQPDRLALSTRRAWFELVVGIPVVLFMENYDINRVGYHDTHDNMTLINLDYGAALAAITIESVARAAAAELPAGWFESPIALS